MCRARYSGCGFLALALCVSVRAFAAEPPPGPGFPSTAWQSPDNAFHAELTRIARFDMEPPDAPQLFTFNGSSRTVSGASAISGSASLSISPSSAVILNTSAVRVEPQSTYVVEYQYRVMSATGDGLPVGLGFVSGDGQIAFIGGSSTLNGGSGKDSRRFRTGALGGLFVLLTAEAEVVIDNIEVYREDAKIQRSTLPLPNAAFPRLFNYSLGSPENAAFRSGMKLDDVFQTFSRYDMLVGVESDHTFGDGAWPQRLRAANPNLRILPYVNPFMAQYLDRKVEAGSAGLLPLFNSGLYPDWFMRGPERNLLISPDFQSNVQMNHTYLSPVHNDLRFRDYMAAFISQSMLTSGLWDGVHLDQPEWYPNPTLVDRTRDGELPPIDIDGDGVADARSLLNKAWDEGYNEFFRTLYALVGNARLLFNNAGYIPGNKPILGTANGWLNEMTQPYNSGADGDWDTRETGGWYRLVQNYLTACANARAPQIVSMEFSGIGIGKLNGKLTANGFPDRTSEIDIRDYKRMRLGLTTTLLGNGFFEYDLVDNTSIPLWFDEYAVDRDGNPTTDLSGKGYLGQPLAAAVELPNPARHIIDQVDFEATKSSGIVPGPDFEIVSDPALVIGGKFSMARKRATTADDGFLFYSDTVKLPLEVGKTYTVAFDYKVTEYNPSTYLGLLGLTFTMGENARNSSRGNSLYFPDMEGAGQQGHLRTTVKIGQAGTQIFAGLIDTGKVIVDNITVEEGGGGVWRRDFENGVVLVNPTPDPLIATQADVAGPLQRTGIRTIKGKQAPQWNDGHAVTAGIAIPPGDGIILLADPIALAPLAMPTALVVTQDDGSLTLSWKNSGPAEGYRVWYGTGDAEREAASSQTSILLSDMEQPGVRYHARVAAYDFKGATGPVSEQVEWLVAGDGRALPQILVPADGRPLTPGGVGTVLLSGAPGITASRAVASPFPIQMNGVYIRVNGTPAPLVSVSADRVEFLTPWQVVGPTVTLQLMVNGLPSPVVTAQWSAADVAFAYGGKVFHTDHVTVADAGQPIGLNEQFAVLVSGAGLVEPPPQDTYPTGGAGARTCLAVPRVTIAGGPAQVAACVLAQDHPGAYWLTLTRPDAVQPGLQNIVLSDSPSTPIAGYFQ